MQTNNKLREALVEVQKRANGALLAISYENVPIQHMWDIIDVCKAALAEPVRNCDVGTPEEQARRWYWRYHVGHLCQSCPLGPIKWSEIDKRTLCFSEWLQMPYEEGGAK